MCGWILAGVVGRDVRRGWWLENGGREGGVTNVTGVGVLNCDCGELGFAVSGLRGNVVCAFGR